MAAFQIYLQSMKERKVTGGQVRWVRRVGVAVMLLLVKNPLVKIETWDSALLWCNSQFFCHQSSGWSLLTFSHSCP
jgi:3-methyladenine DNA glycosylase AlkD